MGDDMATMGNFKGVMLCNRPAQIPGSLQTMVGSVTHATEDEECTHVIHTGARMRM